MLMMRLDASFIRFLFVANQIEEFQVFSCWLGQDSSSSHFYSLLKLLPGETVNYGFSGVLMVLYGSIWFLMVSHNSL